MYYNKDGDKMKFKKIFNIVLYLLLFIFISIFLLSLYQIINWSIDNKKTKEEIDKINDIVKIEKVKDNQNTEIIESNDSYDNPYWKYIYYDLLNVSFNELKAVNNDTIAFVNVPDTNINYPVVRGGDNDFYLTHSFDKSYNDAGWVFMDYRNDLINDKNTIIYAHSRLDKTMFGSLSKTLRSEWLNDPTNHIINISSEKENRLYQIFSVYTIPTTSDYLRTSFSSDNDYLNFINAIKGRSIYDFNTIVTEDDTILTLSTCYNNYDKLVIHAKLIKKETR